MNIPYSAIRTNDVMVAAVANLDKCSIISFENGKFFVDLSIEQGIYEEKLYGQFEKGLSMELEKEREEYIQDTNTKRNKTETKEDKSHLLEKDSSQKSKQENETDRVGGIRRGPWTPDEDRKLMEMVSICGASNWKRISGALVTRTSKQCRERYHQNVKPTLNKSPITPEEGALIEKLLAKYGKKWAEIARHLNNRSDNAVKNWSNGEANRRRRASVQKAKTEKRDGATLSDLHSSKKPATMSSRIPNIALESNTPNLSPHSLSPNSFPKVSFNTSIFSSPEPRWSSRLASLMERGSVPATMPGGQIHQHPRLPSVSLLGVGEGNYMPHHKLLQEEHNPQLRRHSYYGVDLTPYTLRSEPVSESSKKTVPSFSSLRQSLSSGNNNRKFSFSASLGSSDASRKNSISLESGVFKPSATTSLAGSEKSSYNPETNKNVSVGKNVSNTSFSSPFFGYAHFIGSTVNESGFEVSNASNESQMKKSHFLHGATNRVRLSDYSRQTSPSGETALKNPLASSLDDHRNLGVSEHTRELLNEPYKTHILDRQRRRKNFSCKFARI